MVFAGPDGETAQPLWAAEFPFCPVEVSLSLGALYPLFALLPLAGILLLPWNLWAGGSVILCALGWNLVLYYLGKSRIQGDLEHLRSFSALLWVAEELAKLAVFPRFNKN